MADPAPYSNPGMSGLLTPEQIAMNRKLGQTLMMQGMSTEPVGHWTQGLARVLQAGVGRSHMTGADDAQKQRQEAFTGAIQQSPTFAGMSPADRNIMSMDPELARSVFAKTFSPPQTDDIKEYEYAKRQGFHGQLSDWMAIKRKGAEEEYNKNLVYGTDERGNIVPMQAGTKGNLVASRLPPGVALQRDPIKFDAGDRYILLDPTTRQPIGQIPKNIAAVEEQKVAGETRGKAVADLPRVIDTAQQTLQVIQQIREHPGKRFGIGVAGVLPAIPGTPQAGFVDLVNQAKGRAFLEAFNSLRGGGAITEIEGKKASEAIARLERARRPEDFDKALDDLELIVQRGVAKAYQMAGRQPGQPPPAERVNSGPGVPVAPQQATPPSPQPAPLPAQQRVYADPPPQAIEDLMRNPSEQMKRFFEDHFKLPKGAADEYLKGRR